MASLASLKREIELVSKALTTDNSDSLKHGKIIQAIERCIEAVIEYSRAVKTDSGKAGSSGLSESGPGRQLI
jgi:hypothetical protein